jgi:diacylglycerol kinase (ATP)
VARELHAIVNPMSGGGRTRRQWPRVAATLETIGWTVRSHVTSAPGQAARIARELLSAGARELLSVGGDGTANEIANGFFCDGEAVAPDAVLSVLPTGTGHDFGRSIGVRTAADAVAALAQGRICRIDVGMVEYQVGDGRERRCFVNAADVGIGAFAAATINRSPKLLGAFLTYLAGTARAIMRFESQAARVVVDGATVSEGAVDMVLIANGRFHGGGMRLAPMAQMADGFFEVYVLHAIPKHTLFLSLLPRAYTGRHMGYPAVQYVRGRDVEVQAAGLPLEVDGEQPGTSDIHVRLLPQALRIRVPSGNACP